MTTLPLLDHEAVIAAATEMAREAVELVGFGFAWDEMHPAEKDRVLDRYAALLCDLDREASRDHWVRWGGKHEGEFMARAFSNRAATETPPRGWMANPDGEESVRRRARDRWLALRDNPAALAAAVLAALTPLDRSTP